MLDVQSKQEEVREDHCAQEQPRDVGSSYRPHPEDAERHQRARRTPLDDEEGERQGDCYRQKPDRARRRPADGGRLGDCVGDEHEARRRRQRPEDVEVTRLGLDVALAHDEEGERKYERTDGDIDPEDPLPAELARQHAAGQHTNRSAAPAERTPDTERLVAFGALLELGRDDRERSRRDDGGT